jgi:hypothetical protein
MNTASDNVAIPFASDKLLGVIGIGHWGLAKKDKQCEMFGMPSSPPSLGFLSVASL